MNTCAVADVASLQQGDHICIWDTSRWPFRYTHHGIVVETGACSDAIAIAHVWSFIDNFRESHADSCFRQTSLTAFLNARPLSDMRRVQYNSSLVGNALSKLGEVHRAKSDIPPIVLARCAFLLGLGKGHFSILSLNCEHVALWCKTGVVWSKQLFHKASTKAPFLPPKYANLLTDLDATVAQLKREQIERNDALARLHGKRVYLQLRGTLKFVKRLGDDLYAVLNDPHATDLAFRHQPTPFVVDVHVEAYNCVHVSLMDAETGKYVCAKAKSIKLLTRRAYHRESMFAFEFAWHGELQSRRNRRWYVGAQTRDGLLRTFNQRDRASAFEIVDAAFIDAMSVEIEPVAGDPVSDAGRWCRDGKARSPHSRDDEHNDNASDASETETERSSYVTSDHHRHLTAACAALDDDGDA